MRNVLLRFGPVAWTARVEPAGTPLRTLLIEACLPTYNGAARWINCRGMGTCGTCAMVVRPSNPAVVSAASFRERLRLSFPPHSAANTDINQLRLACQTRLTATGNGQELRAVDVSKQGGMWGHNGQNESQSEEPVVLGFEEQQIDLEAIRQLRPFPEWLQGEMRSNHAGETGAVNIYIGCQAALALRKWLLPSHLLRHDTELSEFAAEHENSERTHLVMLNQVLDDRRWIGGDRSMLLPVWRRAGWCLGFLSSVFWPQVMYQTTEAVETFVEEHFMSQIQRLETELTTAAGDGRRDLKRLLELCCEDEVHHKEDARKRSIALQGADGSTTLSDLWMSIVRVGSIGGAEVAKRV